MLFRVNESMHAQVYGAGAALVLFVVGVLIAGFGAWLIVIGGSANGWVNATGAVSATKIINYTTYSKGTATVNYEAVVNYTYTFGGRTYGASWRGNSVSSTGYGDAQTTASEHPAGSTILILVNPNDSASSKPVYALSNSVSGGIWLVGFGLLFVVIGIYSFLKYH
jgi:hypothetical protein